MKQWKNWWPAWVAWVDTSSFLCLLARGLIAIYRNCLSGFLGSDCRFYPTCSCYAEESFQRYGFVRALALTLRRLSHCHPLGPSGYDPVPELQTPKYSQRSPPTLPHLTSTRTI